MAFRDIERREKVYLWVICPMIYVGFFTGATWFCIKAGLLAW